MSKSWLLVTPLIALLAACAGEDDATAVESDEVKKTQANDVSGFDLEGPKALKNDKVTAELCAAVVSPVREACDRAEGRTSRSNGCQDLCSVPIAPRGKAAGYDMTGYKQLAVPAAPGFCPAVVSPVRAACARAGGSTSVAGCAVLCTKPVARDGEAAGYDLTGFKILPNDKVTAELCAAVISPVQQACQRVGGEISRVNGCGQLCSLPL